MCWLTQDLVDSQHPQSQIILSRLEAVSLLQTDLFSSSPRAPAGEIVCPAKLTRPVRSVSSQAHLHGGFSKFHRRHACAYQISAS